MPGKMTIQVGQTFRSTYADSNALWKVKKSRGRGVYECEIVNEPIEINGKTYDGDYAGVCKLFSSKELQGAIELQELVSAAMQEHEDFYGSLVIGQIVHYHDGFGQYVRCEIVLADRPRVGVVEIGEKCLKEIALVGNWRDHDLHPDNYHMRGVREGRLFKPNASNIWENPKFGWREGPRALPDPTLLEPHQIRGQTELFV